MKRKIALLLVSILLVTIILPISTAADSGVYIFRPSGDIVTEWGPGSGSGYTEVDDETPDETSTYIGTGFDGEKDVYSIYSIDSYTVVGVKNVTVYGRFITDSISSIFNLILYKKSTDSYSYSPPIQLSRRGYWETISYTWEMNPFTVADWMDNDISDLGIGICAEYCGKSAVFCTQVYMEVAYSLSDPPVDASIGEIIDSICETELSVGLKNSFIYKLKGAINSLNKNRLNAVINKIEAFINHIEAQSGKKLSDDVADQLIVIAQQIIDNLKGEMETNNIYANSFQVVKAMSKNCLPKYKGK